MAQIERQQKVLNILQNLRDLNGLKKLFWEELNYERENLPLSMRGWPDSARKALVDDPILFASGGEDNAFQVIYCRLASDGLQRSLERPIVSQLIREHPYCLFVFSDKAQSAWHFLNIKFDEKAEKRRLFRRITVRPDGGLRTAAERLQMIDLALVRKELFGIPALEIQKRHDDAFDVESVTKAFYKELANWYFWALKHVRFPKDASKEADGHDHIGVIRMITRLIFCWFVTTAFFRWSQYKVRCCLSCVREKYCQGESGVLNSENPVAFRLTIELLLCPKYTGRFCPLLIRDQFSHPFPGIFGRGLNLRPRFENRDWVGHS
ncbi:MAG: hypothetical protein EHM27_02085 [Deltaproteobacteria bacterium]|nr:MAG: hypothetical protein EHM27_02085 [Deltaproteobacteria bacterium]